MNSTHQIIVTKIKLIKKHPNADTLSLFEVFNYPYVGKTNDWLGKELCVFIPPDSLVPTDREEFAFLASEAKYDEFSNKKGVYARIKGKRLRSELSYGLCLPAPPNVKEGDDLSEFYGVKHFDPLVVELAKENQKANFLMGGEVAKPPRDIHPPYFDVESFMRYGKDVFLPGEEVFLFEKIHGCSSCFVYQDNNFHCKSRNEWKVEFPIPPKFNRAEILTELILRGVPDEYLDVRLDGIKAKIDKFIPQQNLYWKVLRNNEPLMKFLRDNPSLVVFGEIAGQVKNYDYGHSKENPGFFGFDIWKDGKFLDVLESEKLAQENNIPWVPKIAELPFDFDEILKYASGTTRVPNAKHQIEGVVIRVPKERWHSSCGRVILKLISPDFYNG